MSRREPRAAAEQPEQEFEDLLELLRENRGFDFTAYKRGTLQRRFQKRMDAAGVESYAEYGAYLLAEPPEFDRLFNTVLINVTQFFRDGVPWQYVAEELLPQIVASKRHEESIRAWSAGCATGEEAYTLAIVLAEALGEDEFLRRVKIYATDVDDDALGTARAGAYTAENVEPVPEALRDRYFERHGKKYLFRKKLRRAIIFGRNDLTADAPISKIDLLVCRNTLMYFDAKTQVRILNRFHFALREGGFILLGKAETLTTHGNKFRPIDFQRRVFSKTTPERKRPKVAVAFAVERRAGARADDDLSVLADAAYDKARCAQLVVDAAGALALANDNARSLFKLHPADIGRPLQDLEFSYRPVELRSLIEQVRLNDRPVRVPEVLWAFAGEERWFAVQLVPLFGVGSEMIGVAVSFEDVTPEHNLKVEIERSHAELETAYEELQSTNEELETTNEELQSTVEELETTNEELQSTNEELETMNEELHSTNDELNLFNVELRRRGTEVDEANQFLETIFSSLQEGVAVVDRGLRLQVWNRHAEEMWGLRAEEVLDTPLASLDIGLPVKEVGELVLATLNDGDRSSERTLDATNRRGKKILCRITSTPLMGPDGGVPRGAIVLMEQLKNS